MRDIPKSVMLFAAGFGTRMQHLTQDMPKPLIKVSGRTLVDHALVLAEAVQPDVIVANLHYMPQMLEQHLAPLGVKTVLESPHILETGGGLRNAMSLLGSGPVWTMNTDAIWSGPNPLKMLRTAWQPDKMDALLMCIPTSQAVSYDGVGDFKMNEQGQLNRAPGLVYGGVQIIKTTVLLDIKDTSFSLNVPWNSLLADQRLYGLSYPGQWCDVGHPDGIEAAEALLRQENV
mgnify:CR=1 FL=1